MSIAKYYRNKPVLLKGTVRSSVDEKRAANAKKKTFTLDVHQVRANWGWEDQTGKILVDVFRDLDISYGDSLQLEGTLHRPYNFANETNFSYRDYLQHRGIYFILSVKKDSNIAILARNKGNYLKSASLRLRKRLGNILSGNLSNNESGIMKAILLGDRSAVSKPVRELFVQTGTAHILAISGLHIGVVAAIFLMLMKLIPAGGKWQSAGVIGLLIGYAFLTGGRPSVVRATIMMIVFLAGFIIEKERDTLNTLFLAAMIILIYNPLNLFDVGFQLSFVCILSIILLNDRSRQKRTPLPLGERNTGYDRLIQFVLRSMAVSTAVWFGVAGFIAYYFNIVTPVTIFANLAVVPLISVIVTLGFGLLITGMILPSWAFLFAGCLKVVLNAMVGIIFLFDKVPFAYVYLKNVNIWHVVTYYGMLFVLIFVPLKPRYLMSRILKIFHLGRIDKRLRV
jgi:competence protein ComEC